MRGTGDRFRTPAGERWFWVGVGFVSALAILLLGLVFVTSLTAREKPVAVARQPVRPAPRVSPTSAELPAPPRVESRRVTPPIRPEMRPTAVAAPRANGPSVRVVERPRPPRETAPAADRTATSPARAHAQPPADAGGGPEVRSGRGSDQAVAGSRDGWIARSSPLRRARSGAPTHTRATTSPPVPLTPRDAEYPVTAMDDGVTGTVGVKLIVDPKGFVERAIVVESSDDARLDNAAVRAAMLWHYQPALRDGRPVPGTDEVTFEFYRDRNR